MPMTTDAQRQAVMSGRMTASTSAVVPGGCSTLIDVRARRLEARTRGGAAASGTAGAPSSRSKRGRGGASVADAPEAGVFVVTCALAGARRGALLACSIGTVMSRLRGPPGRSYVRPMLVVGLTGGIGSGKSTVADLLVARGAVLIDADRIAREVVEPGGRAYQGVVDRFGPGVVAADGTIDRPALAAIVFHDEQARRDLNGITHPAVGAVMAERM